MARATQKRIERATTTARVNFRLNITTDVARAVVRWDDEQCFAHELADDGQLDTAPRDYFGMALVAALMPGKPTVQDEFISRPLERWHFPLNGSSDDYSAAFWAAWRKATKDMRRKR